MGIGPTFAPIGLRSSDPFLEMSDRQGSDRPPTAKWGASGNGKKFFRKNFGDPNEKKNIVLTETWG